MYLCTYALITLLLAGSHLALPGSGWLSVLRLKKGAWWGARKSTRGRKMLFAQVSIMHISLAGCWRMQVSPLPDVAGCEPSPLPDAAGCKEKFCRMLVESLHHHSAQRRDYSPAQYAKLGRESHPSTQEGRCFFNLKPKFQQLFTKHSRSRLWGSDGPWCGLGSGSLISFLIRHGGMAGGTSLAPCPGPCPPVETGASALTDLLGWALQSS